jgi:hypothetical protein
MPTSFPYSIFLVAGLVVFEAAQVLAQTPAEPVAMAAASPAGSPPPRTLNPQKELPTPRDLLEKYETVTGGHEVWTTFHTRSMKGLYQTEDGSGFAAIEVLSKEPNKALSKITLSNGIVLREICDGKAAWIEDPRGGMHSITGPALASRVRRANFNDRSTMLLAAVTGHVVGTEKVGTHSTYVMQFSPDKNITSKLYFDIDSGLVVRADDAIHTEEGDYKVETYLDDYRPVDGAYFPFRLRHVEKGSVFTMRMTQIKNNAPIDDSVFLKPESAPK